ncbi:TIGR00730 family Rossman fold protein [Thermomicrobium sp. CFH 73360]|uniref:Cytokinin riboside 5'-monophosphate phosphoribohydrolase n=1 Tax=Thermomicrobium roseum TaxID=500 RepID=A0A7C5VWE9_THERO|nr:TIGR00730 family Rossman fold protein [Thermomicrobium sp. CFH 73360]MCM8746892.1 TIGR00730 family Rossman fold protein [Thermomicrobium sp. CFH 73360]
MSNAVTPPERICIFCGSRLGNRPIYRLHAERLARLLAERGIGIVYGGGSIGLMGVVADAALEAGGEVIGVIPEVLMAREFAHPNLTHLHIVRTMHERKALMSDLADGFVALPGGFGTLDELFEIVTWAQLGIHSKPVVLLNSADYYRHLLASVRHAVEEGFITPEHAGLLVVTDDPEEAVEALLTYQPPIAVPRWVGREER